MRSERVHRLVKTRLIIQPARSVEQLHVGHAQTGVMEAERNGIRHAHLVVVVVATVAVAVLGSSSESLNRSAHCLIFTLILL